MHVRPGATCYDLSVFRAEYAELTPFRHPAAALEQEPALAQVRECLGMVDHVRSIEPRHVPREKPVGGCSDLVQALHDVHLDFKIVPSGKRPQKRCDADCST